MINAGHKGHEEPRSSQRISHCDRCASLVSVVILHFISRGFMSSQKLSDHKSTSHHSFSWCKIQKILYFKSCFDDEAMVRVMTGDFKRT
jgi:hypothetical protein